MFFPILILLCALIFFLLFFIHLVNCVMDFLKCSPIEHKVGKIETVGSETVFENSEPEINENSKHIPSSAPEYGLETQGDGSTTNLAVFPQPETQHKSQAPKSPIHTTIYVPSHTQGGRLRMKYISYLGIDPQKKQHMHILERTRRLHEAFFKEKIAHHVEAVQSEILDALAAENKLAVERKQDNDIMNGTDAERITLVHFFNQVEVIPIEKFTEYSAEEKLAYWAGGEELRNSAERNIIEYEYEGFNWEAVIEEDKMLLIEGVLTHPVFTDA